LYELLVLVVKRLRKHHAFVESSLVLHECSIMPFQPFLTFLDACIRVLSRNGQSVSQEASDHIMGGFETSVTEKLLMLDAQYSPHPQPPAPPIHTKKKSGEWYGPSVREP
jgi:hypothetical protein